MVCLSPNPTWYQSAGFEEKAVAVVLALARRGSSMEEAADPHELCMRSACCGGTMQETVTTGLGGEDFPSSSC